MSFYVALYYCKEIAFIDNEQKHGTLHSQDIDCRHFLHGMCQTYRSLTSQDESNVFDINCDQNIELNQYIHFAHNNWEACQVWYHEHRHSAATKNSHFCFVPQSWQKFKSPAYRPDYVQDIRNNINLTSSRGLLVCPKEQLITPGHLPFFQQPWQAQWFWFFSWQ